MINQDQLMSLLRTLLAAGGPVAGLLVQYGMPSNKVNLWLSLALIILPPIAAGVWGILNKTDSAQVVQASTISKRVSGVESEVTVDPNAVSNKVLLVALDPTNPVKVTQP